MHSRTAFYSGVLAISLFLATGASSIVSAAAMQKDSVKSNSSVPLTPELASALDRVNKAKDQLDTASKQLLATKALLKAAGADYKAAKAEYTALELKQHAQNLAAAAVNTNAGQSIAATQNSFAVDSVKSADRPAMSAGNDFSVEHLPQGELQSPQLR